MDIEINTQVLKNDAGEMSSALQNARNSMNKIHAEIQTLNGMWKGEANRAFNVQYNSDYENMTEICGIIEKLIESIKEASRKYDECEGDVNKIVSSIQI